MEHFHVPVPSLLAVFHFPVFFVERIHLDHDFGPWTPNSGILM